MLYQIFFRNVFHVFSTKADQKGGSIHKKRNLSTEIHILAETKMSLAETKTSQVETKMSQAET